MAKPLFIDNTACISLIKNPQISQRSEHIEIRYYFVREKVESGEFEIHHISTERNIADFITKILCKQRFQNLRSLAGIINGENDSSSRVDASNR